MTFVEGDRDKGRVITGSSNFTEAGLQDNLEFNVELKNRADYEFAHPKFNELWAKSVDVTKDYVTTIELKSPYAQFTPYELYLKFLYEYFRGELNLPDEIEDIYCPRVSRNSSIRRRPSSMLARFWMNMAARFSRMSSVSARPTCPRCSPSNSTNRVSSLLPAPLDENNPGSWPNVFRDFGSAATCANPSANSTPC